MNWYCTVCHRRIREGRGWVGRDLDDPEWNALHVECDPTPDNGEGHWFAVELVGDARALDEMTFRLRLVDGWDDDDEGAWQDFLRDQRTRECVALPAAMIADAIADVRKHHDDRTAAIVRDLLYELVQPNDIDLIAAVRDRLGEQ